MLSKQNQKNAAKLVFERRLKKLQLFLLQKQAEDGSFHLADYEVRQLLETFASLSKLAAQV